MIKKKLNLPPMYLGMTGGTTEWYIGLYFPGETCDLYEAEQIINGGGRFEGNQIYFLHYPDSAVYTPFEIKENVYYEDPLWDNGRFGILAVDFTEKKIILYTYVPGEKPEILVALPLSEVKDCNNLKLEISPWTIGRQSDNTYEMIWPVKKIFPKGDNEGILYRNGSVLYFYRWVEEPKYQEFIVTIDIETGEEIEVEKGSLYRMPDGTLWNV